MSYVISISSAPRGCLPRTQFWTGGERVRFVNDRRDAKEFSSVAAAHREVRYHLPHLFDECCIDIIPAPQRVQS